MADLIRVERTGTPWEPTAEAQIHDEFDRWDVPTMGLIEQAGSLHFFSRLLVLPTDENVSLWFYAHVSPDEAEALRQAEGDSFDAAVRYATSDRYVLVAMYSQGVMLTQTSPHPVKDGLWSEPMGEVIDTMLESLVAQLQQIVASLQAVHEAAEAS